MLYLMVKGLVRPQLEANGCKSLCFQPAVHMGSAFDTGCSSLVVFHCADNIKFIF